MKQKNVHLLKAPGRLQKKSDKNKKGLCRSNISEISNKNNL